MSRAQVALAWLRTNPVVVAPSWARARPAISTTPSHRSTIESTGEEIAQLEEPYTPRYDFQGISDDAELQRIMRALPNFTTSDVTQDESSI